MKAINKGCILFISLLFFYTGQVSAAISTDDGATNKESLADLGRNELNSLFAKLAAADTREEGQSVVNKIWHRWFNTDNQTVNAMLQGVMDYRRDQNIKQALILSDRIVAKFPAYSEGWNQRATLFYMLGDFHASLADIEQTLVREPRHFGALAGRASIYVLQGEIEKAREVVKQALAFNPFLNEKGILGEAN
ncbi:MAG: tetratricopeptide (TPR) repeat protein [Saprospiraceae bacterium]|jgi:tetratricopeptide (TPR) repeat protein